MFLSSFLHFQKKKKKMVIMMDSLDITCWLKIFLFSDYVWIIIIILLFLLIMMMMMMKKKKPGNIKIDCLVGWLFEDHRLFYMDKQTRKHLVRLSPYSPCCCYWLWSLYVCVCVIRWWWWWRCGDQSNYDEEIFD